MVRKLLICPLQVTPLSAHSKASESPSQIITVSSSSQKSLKRGTQLLPLGGFRVTPNTWLPSLKTSLLLCKALC